TGFIENKMVPTYLKAADVLLMPYTRDTPTYRWMSPLKLFEYMAAGKPIIATDLVAIKSKIKDMETGILIREKSGEEIADAIMLIMDNKALADKLSRNVEREAEKYSLRKRVETILKEFIKAKK
ncbi:MAG: glycosyltransferase family 4 protein, partial [Bacteroidales bacterium]|nr:glycosyltransferase family 4 protein [Bacteroidales bacterium]